MTAPTVIGWDVGGAHVKACLTQRGAVVDVMQWACPLWQGLDHLEAVLASARARWPGLPQAHHAITMTGEMVDLFPNREAGVQGIAGAMERALCADAPSHAGSAAPRVRFFAGDAGWCGAADVAARWQAVASANWLASARHAALRLASSDRPDAIHGVLIDIGSTTTDLIAFDRTGATTRNRSDAERLAGGELVYHGVVRTPLCAVAPRIVWRGTAHNVMNEFFATAADVYRATGELDPAHDPHPSADHAAKDLPATHQRLARMIGLDARDGSDADWLALARAWRAAQVATLGDELRRAIDARGDDDGGDDGGDEGGDAASRVGPAAQIVAAGCGAFLVPEVLARARGAHAPIHRVVTYGERVAQIAPGLDPARHAALQRWATVCAPCVAVAALFEREQR